MGITYGEAKRVLAPFAGKGGLCASSPEVDLFTRQVLEYLLAKGERTNLRKFCFHAKNGWITAPYELEAPIKVKIEGEVGTTYSKWVEFYNYAELGDCYEAANALYEEPNRFPTAYDIPSGGAYVGVLGTANEAPDAHIIVQGTDTTGRQVYTNHKGQQISGEYLSITRNELRYSHVKFGAITGIVKTKTTGYVQLYAVELFDGISVGTRTFLSDYAPLEEVPSYRRFKITTPNCGNSIRVSVLGRIRLKPAYADTDILPFDSLMSLSLAGQQWSALSNDRVDVASAKKQFSDDLILSQNEHSRGPTSQPMEVFLPLSGGAIKNII